jgi:hypothetical protein
MKKVILIVLLMPMLLVAKYRSGVVYFNDGTTKNGFLEIPNFDDSKIKFRSTQKGKTEKFKIEDVKSFEVINDANVKLVYETLYLANFKFFSTTETKVSKKKSWVKIVKQGKITLYSAFFSHRNGKELNEGIIYYIKKPENENPLFLHASEVYGFTLHVNAFSALKKTLKVHFDTDCPQLVEMLTKEEIKNKGLTHIVDLYDANCGN